MTNEYSHSKVDTSQLRRIVDRLLRLNQDKKDVADNIKEVYGEAQALGYDRSVVQEIVKICSMEPDARAAREEKDVLVEVYLRALGEQ